MNKRTKNLFKMSAVGCVAIMGVSAASLLYSCYGFHTSNS